MSDDVIDLLRAKKKVKPRGAYWTPHEMIMPLLGREIFPEPIWEPACGIGRISDVFESIGKKVVTSDLYKYPGMPKKAHVPLNFLDQWDGCRPPFRFKSIITNPPYAKIWKWVENAVLYVRPRPQKIAMLLPAASLGDCAKVLPGSGFSLTRVIVFRRPPKFTGADGVADVNWGAAWFVFTQNPGKTQEERCEVNLPGEIESVEVTIGKPLTR